MAIIFSKVSAHIGDKITEFLVGGYPHSQEELTGWTAYQGLLLAHRGQEITFDVDARRYGGEEDYTATPEEVAYMYQRIQLQPDFVESRTEHIGSCVFTALS